MYLWDLSYPVHPHKTPHLTLDPDLPSPSADGSVGAVIPHLKHLVILSAEMPSRDAQQRCPAEMPCRDALQRCPAEMPSRDALQRCPAEMPCRDAQQRCPAEMPFRDAQQRCPAEMPCRDALQSCAVPNAGWVKLRFKLKSHIMSNA
jgi:hypothetical protein